ncbi:hypothetical protein Lser_V15G02111 [Lactuca serriola]
MKPKSVESFLMIAILLILTYLYLGIERGECDCGDVINVQKAGRIRDITGKCLNATVMENLARFAVKEHSEHVNCIIKFDRLIKARKQVMTSKMYYLTLEAQDGRVYEAKVLVKPWMNFKELQDFKAIDA